MITMCDAPSDNFLNSAPIPTSGLCPIHGWHPLWRWTISEGPSGAAAVEGVCLAEQATLGPCGCGAVEWREEEDPSLLLITCRLRPAREAWTQVGRVSVDMGVDKEGNARPALIVRAACDIAQAAARELIV